MNKIAFKLIDYNKKGVKKANKIKMITLYFILLSCFIGILVENVLLFFYNIKLVLPEYFYYLFFVLAIAIVLLGAKIGYHENKWIQIGRLEIEDTFIRIDINEVIIEYNFEKFKIRFLDNGFEGKSNWKFPTKVGMLSFDSGVNDIYLINRENELEVHEYSFLIENEERLKGLYAILKNIRLNYNKEQ